MVKKHQIIYSPQSRQQLKDIRRWTAKNFGTAQAGRYIGEMKKLFLSIGEFGDTSQPVPDTVGLYQFIFLYRAGGHGHRIFWRRKDKQIEIVRVIHTAQDVG